jgi:type I restriction enzyme M protein
MATSIAAALVKLGIETPLPNGALVPPGKPALGVGRACREGISDTSPFTDFRDYLEVVIERLREHRLGIVLMLDEFDKLQEGIDHGVTSPQVPENIRFLVQSYPKFSAILTGSRRLKRLREEYWSALYGLGTRFGVSALDPDDARRLVIEPVKDKLTFSPEAVDRAISITAGQPYLLQCLCNRIFDYAADTKARSITLDVVEQASAKLVKDNEHFASLWDYAASHRRRLILMLCSQRSKPTEQVSFGELLELLTQRGIEITDEKLDADLSYLRELELIELVGTSADLHYQLAIPLMAAWMETQQDFNVVLRQAQAEAQEENG